MTVRASLGSDRARLGLITLGGDIGFPGLLSRSQSQAVALAATVARTRLLTQQGGQQRLLNTSFEDDALGGAPAGWGQFLNNGAPAPTTFAVQNGWASDGTKSMRLTTGNHTANGQALYLIQSGISVVPGTRYIFGADVNVLSLPNTMVARCMIEWHDASGAYISQSYGVFSPSAANNGQVVRSFMQVLAPSTAATGRAIFHITGGTGVGDVYVDNLTFQYVPTLIASVARTQAPTQAQAVALLGTVRRTMALTQAQAANLAAVTARLVAASQAQAANLAAATARTMAPAQTQASTRSEAIGRIILGPSQAALPALVGAARRTMAPAQTQASTRSEAVGLILVVSQAELAATPRASSRAMALTQDAGATLARRALRSLNVAQAGGAGAHGALSRILGPSQAALPALVGAQERTISLTQSATALGAGPQPRTVVLSQAQAPARGPQQASRRFGAAQASVPVRRQLVIALSATQPQLAVLTSAGRRAATFTVALDQAVTLRPALAGRVLTAQSTSVRVLRVIGRELALEQRQHPLLLTPSHSGRIRVHVSRTSALTLTLARRLEVQAAPASRVSVEVTQ